MPFNIRGKVSHFGGPEDMGVSASEGLAFIYEVDMAPHLFLPTQPPGTTGLARRLDPQEFYIACRWKYDAPNESKTDLLTHTALVRSPKTGKQFIAHPSDWGPHESTGRIADISPGLMEALGIQTDDDVEVIYPYDAEQEEKPAMPYNSIVISSGHGLKVRGAHGILDEVDEARRVVAWVANELRDRGVMVKEFHDDTSTSQNQNLNTIVNYHNAQSRDLDVSVHFNAYEQVSKPMGTEVLYVTQTALAADVSSAIADAGSFINRGAKKRTDLFFLNSTNKPAILIEVCFVDSEADADLYESAFEEICSAICDVLGGPSEVTAPPPIDETEPPPPRPIHPPIPSGRIDIAISGDVTVTINGVTVWPDPDDI